MQFKEFRQNLADEFIKVLEEKGVEWKQEWKNISVNGWKNGITQRPYRGLNLFNLFFTALRRGYKDPRWCTFRQIADEKYHPGQEWKLKKGSKAAKVEYWLPFDLVEKKSMSWEMRNKLIEDGKRTVDDFRTIARYYSVFNADCIEGIPLLEPKLDNDIDISAVISKISENMHVPIIFEGDKAFYFPEADEVHMPEKGLFEDEYGLNATALHELSHATGHPSRLNRHVEKYGSPEYAFEELVAEISSCFMAGDIGCEMSKEHIENHKAYVRGWITVIKNDPEKLVEAVKQAEQAANYLNYQGELITEKEYRKLAGNIREVPKRETMDEEVEKLCAKAADFIRSMDRPDYSLEQFHKEFPDMTHVPVIDYVDQDTGKRLTVEFDFVNFTQTRYINDQKLDTMKYKTAEDMRLVLQVAIPEDFIPAKQMSEKAKEDKSMDEYEMTM